MILRRAYYILYYHTSCERTKEMRSVTGISTGTKSLIQISAIIPVYNQEREISILLKRLKEALNSTLLDYELVIVNDGSCDSTLKILRKQQELDARIQIISYPENKGKGYAVKKGIMHTHGEIVLFVDGDLEISPDTIKDYIRELQSCDVVIASKSHPLSKVNAPESRKFLSRAFNLYVRIMTGVRLKDTQSGLKAGDGNVLRTIFRIIHIDRYAFDVELLAVATALNVRIKELPIEITLNHRLRLNDIAKMFIDVIAISYKLRISRWYKKQLKLLVEELQNFQNSKTPAVEIE
jgi:glycosyltransferase involved in cell wall biosynthesis